MTMIRRVGGFAVQKQAQGHQFGLTFPALM
jgi:hypothetical protein